MYIMKAIVVDEQIEMFISFFEDSLISFLKKKLIKSKKNHDNSLEKCQELYCEMKRQKLGRPLNECFQSNHQFDHHRQRSNLFWLINKSLKPESLLGGYFPAGIRSIICETGGICSSEISKQADK